MTDPAPFLLIVVSCLVTHVVFVTGMVAPIGCFQPIGWSVWRASSSGSRPPAWERWMGNVFGALLLAMPTGLMVLAILRPERAGGGFGVPFAVIELALATAWTGYLLLGARGPRAW